MGTNSGWGDMTVLQYLGQGLADQKQQRISMNNRLERGGIALDPDLAAEIKAVAVGSEERYNQMLLAEYERVVPEYVRKWAAAVPGMATGELFPRIIAALGHPRIATPRRPDPDDPARKLISEPSYIRGPQQLRQYAGAGDPNRKPEKGMSQEDLFAMGKIKQVRPLLYTWSSSLVKMATPAKPGSKHPGDPKSVYAMTSRWWRIFTEAKQLYAGHESKCPEGAWPLPCAGSHRRHSWLVSTAGQDIPRNVTATSEDEVRMAAQHLGYPVLVTPWHDEHINSSALIQQPDNHAENLAELDALIPWLPKVICKNKKIPPTRPNGCGIGVHPEWGAVGAPWRPGHIDMAAHRRLHQQFLNGLWEAAGADGLTPYEFRWMQSYDGFKD